MLSMPLYMDRHDLSGISEEELAEAHDRDVALQHEHGADCHTYWFDEATQSAFCLIEAPNPDAIQALHGEAHGELASEIIEVDPAVVQAFMGRTRDPEPLPEAPTRPPRESAFRALMFTDMVGSTEITNRLGDERALELVRAHDRLIRDRLGEHGGREVDRAGDGFLTCFLSVGEAVRCAVEIQRGLRALNEQDLDGPVRVRIGLGAGEPVRDGDALFGSVVNLTARICDSAAAGQILVAPVVRELCLGKPIRFADRGEKALKGFSDPVRLHEVQWE
jgi:class 3 adenylate cyclase